ncbi:Ig-like domain-containing protein, partial [Pseudomonas fluorescens]
TDDRTPTLNGTAEANSIVHIYNGTTLLGSTQATPAGTWSYTTPTLNFTNYTFKATATDEAENTSGYSAERSIVIDTAAPTAPVITAVMDNAGTATGDIANGGSTDDTTPTLRGTAEANSIVKVYNGTTLLGSVQATPAGTWEYTHRTALTNGTTYTFRATATDAAENVSGYSANRAVIIDTTAPTAPVITTVMDNVGNATGNIANGGNTDDTTPTLNGTAEAGSVVRITVDNGAVYSVTATGGTWTWTPPAGLALGNHSFSVTATDAADNTSGATTRTLTIVAPTTSGTENFEGAVTGKPMSYASGLNIISAPGNDTARIVYSQVGGPADWSNGLHFGPDSGGGTVSPGPMVFNVGGTTDITFNISGYGGSGQAGQVASIIILDTAGAQLYSGTTGGTSFTFTAPTGRLIGNISLDTNDNSGLMIDNLVWGAQTVVTTAAISSTESVEEVESSKETAADEHAAATLDHDTHTLTLTNAEQPIDLSYILGNNEPVTTVDMANGTPDVLNITLDDVLSLGEMNAFIEDGMKQMMIQGEEGDVVNLDDQLNGTDPTEWAKATQAVEVAGVRYDVFQHSTSSVELLVQEGVTTNLT